MNVILRSIVVEHALASLQCSSRGMMVQQKRGGLLVVLRERLRDELFSAGCCQPVQLQPNMCPNSSQ